MEAEKSTWWECVKDDMNSFGLYIAREDTQDKDGNWASS